MDFDNQRFDHIYHIPGESGSLSYNVIGAFTEDREGNIVIGTERGGVNVLDGKRRAHRVYEHSAKNPNSISGNIVKALHTDEEGNTWLGIFKGGLNLLDTKTGRAVRFPEKTENSATSLHTAIINDIATQRMEIYGLPQTGMGASILSTPS